MQPQEYITDSEYLAANIMYGRTRSMHDVKDTRSGSDDLDYSEMERLLLEPSNLLKEVKRGEVVEGIIASIDPEEVLVDIGLKSEAVLPTKELPQTGYGSLAEMHVGENVLVYIVQTETSEGHAVVSLRKARMERQWRVAAEQFERGDIIEAKVVDFNKGGLIVDLDGLRGFVPISQLINLRRDEAPESAESTAKLQAMNGKVLRLKVIEINRSRNRLILSERMAAQEWKSKRREELLDELKVGEVRKGVVSNIANFGAFVDIGGADGLVHISQLAWSRVSHPSEVLKIGQEVEVQILSIDKEKKKIALSLKRSEVDPWTDVANKFSVNQITKATITKIAQFGAFARVEDGIEGLIHLSEVPEGVDLKEAYKEGQEVDIRIIRIDTERRRLGLSLKLEPEPEPAAAVNEAEVGEKVETREAEPVVLEPEAATSALAEALENALKASELEKATEKPAE